MTAVPNNKIYYKNIDNFVFSGEKSSAFGIEGHSSGVPTRDRYLSLLRNVIYKSDWDSTLGYDTSSEHGSDLNQHTQSAYPKAENNYLAKLDSMLTAHYE